MRITAWSAISPFGYGREAFTEGLRAGEPAYLVPDFDIAEVLGAKGTGSMDRSSALAVATVGRLLKDVRTDAATGVVLGTTSGSTATQFAFTRESLTRRKPYFVNPALMPYALMNSAAAQCAIWHGLTGPNTTVANGRMSALVALRYAARLLVAGRASGLVCGAVEEYGEERVLLERHQAGHEVRLGEGCVALFLEPGSGGLAEVVALDTRLAVAASPDRVLVECLRGVLGGAGLEPAAVSTLAFSSADEELLGVERAAVAEVFGDRVATLNPAELVGDTGAVAGMFPVAALLGCAGWAAMTCADRDGMVGCALFRLPGEEVTG